MGLLRKLFSPSSRAIRATGDASVSRSESDSPQRAGRADRLAQLNASLANTPGDAGLLFCRAEILFEWGRYREALQGYVDAESAGYAGAELHQQLGLSYLRTGDVVRAEDRLRRAVAAAPDSAIAHVHLGTLLRALRRTEHAVETLQRAVELNPQYYDALIEFGNCRVDLGDPPGGEVLFRRAIELDPERAVGWQNLGVALRQQDRLEESNDAFSRAMPLDERAGGDLESFVNLAIGLEDLGQRRDALALLEQKLPLTPSTYGHFAYSLSLLGAGRLTEGWHHHEFRWLNEPVRSMRHRGRTPAWAGQDLRGKTIRLRVEQGIGDVIQFVRYAPMLQALGASVQMGNLLGLTDSFRGIDRVLGEAESMLPIDYYANLLSLPRIFGTDVATIPADVPYVSVRPDKAAQWSARITAVAGSLNVGLVWAGNPAHRRDRHRSIALRMFRPTGTEANLPSSVTADRDCRDCYRQARYKSTD